jgi:hypothetical protein
MSESCLLCNSTEPGKQYAFHYGRIASIASSHYANIPETTTRFKLLGSKQVFICKKCVHGHVRRHALIWSGVGFMIALLPAAVFRILTGTQVITQAEEVAFLLFAIALVLITLGMGMIFSNAWMCLTGRCSDYAEKMAIDALRAELEQKEHANAFWTSRQFARLHPIPKS